MVIYKTTNLINCKIYIGQDSKNNPKYLGSGIALNNAIKKYGKENFKKEILEHCVNKKDMDEKEKHWITELNARDKNVGYNITKGGDGCLGCSNKGIIFTKEHKENISKARLGLKFSQEHIDNMSKSRFKYQILCLETGIIYNSANQASKSLNIPSASIIKVCKGIYKQIKGYTFMFNKHYEY